MPFMPTPFHRTLNRTLAPEEVIPPFRVEVHRVPVAVAREPEEVPPWDPTRGFPLSRVVEEVATHPILRAHMRGERPYGPEVEEAFVEVIRQEAPPTKATAFPHLVRRHAGPWEPPRVRSLLPEVMDLGEKAQRYPPDAPGFAKAAARTAEKVGLLHPMSDAVAQWHAIASAVKAVEEFLVALEMEEGASVRDLARAAMEPWRDLVHGEGWTVRPFAYRGDPSMAATDFFLKVALAQVARAWEHPDRLRYLARQYQAAAIMLLMDRVDWRGMDAPEPLEVEAGAMPIIFWELGHLVGKGREAKRCPWCGHPFLPYRATQETCGREACVKGMRRRRQREAVSG